MIRFKKGYIAVYGNNLILRFDKFLVGGEKKVKASAFPPFIFFYDKNCEVEWIVNHEKIHFLQAYETLFVGSFLLQTIERLYARIFLGMSRYEAYHYMSIEQEAYLNHHNPDYLKNRRPFSFFKYIKNKKKFSINEDGTVTVLSN